MSGLFAVVTKANKSVEYDLGNSFTDLLEALRARPHTLKTSNFNYNPVNDMTAFFKPAATTVPKISMNPKQIISLRHTR